MIGEFLSGEAGQFRHIHRESVGSTNDDLSEFARKGDPGNLWLTAGEQLSGKGSRGRDWVSVTGNLYASLLLMEPASPKHFHELTFVAAVCLRNVLQKISTPVTDYKVKWPNDILCNGKKCAGILLEAGQVKKVPFVVIGMGVNVASFPGKTMHKSTSLEDEGVNKSPCEVFFALASEMALTLQIWSRGAGFQFILNTWRENAFGIGERIDIKLPDGNRKSGYFASIDDNGYMLLKSDSGDVSKISTADIFFAS